jgi:hypothetical protein
MQFAMVTATQRNGELVTDFATECRVLREAQMMSVRRLSAANQARLLGNEPDMIAVAQPARLREIENALIDRPQARLFPDDGPGRTSVLPKALSAPDPNGCPRWECRQLPGEGSLDGMCISGR